MNDRLARKLPIQLWQLATSFLPPQTIVGKLPQLNRFFSEEIVWNSRTSAALLWADADNDAVSTLVLHACHKGAPFNQVAILLASSPTVINCKDDDGWTPLLFASMSGSMELVEILLERGADPNAGDEHGTTALMEASFMGHTSTVWILCAWPFTAIHQVDCDGKSALDIAKYNHRRYRDSLLEPTIEVLSMFPKPMKRRRSLEGIRRNGFES